MVTRHFLSILSPDPKHPIPFRNGSGRLDLARAIASPSNPMTARVLVNRRLAAALRHGLRRDAGRPGQPVGAADEPRAPRLPRRPLRRGGLVDQEAPATDHAQQRLPGEQRRQRRRTPRRTPTTSSSGATTCTSSTSRRCTTRSSRSPGRSTLRWAGGPCRSEARASPRRRAVYAFIDRHNPAEILTQFNFPNPSVPTGKRFLTQVPQQQLFLMNSPLVIETARKLTHSPGLHRPDDGRAARRVALPRRLPAAPDAQRDGPLPALRRVEPGRHLARGPGGDRAVGEGLPAGGAPGPGRRDVHAEPPEEESRSRWSPGRRPSGAGRPSTPGPSSRTRSSRPTRPCS